MFLRKKTLQITHQNATSQKVNYCYSAQFAVNAQKIAQSGVLTIFLPIKSFIYDERALLDATPLCTMKITTRIIEEILSNIVGDDLPPLLNLLKDKKNVSEFKLAEQLNISVNQVRNMLYRLYKHNLVSFVRRKDKKKGWYIYYWTLNMPEVKRAVQEFKHKQLDEFRKRLARETEGTFFVCPNRCMRMKQEAAMECEFRCQECGELMFMQDNSRTIENIKNRINELEEELKASEREIDELRKRKRAPKKKTSKKKGKAAKKKTAKKKTVKKKTAKKAAAKKPKAVKKKKLSAKEKKKIIKRPVKKLMKNIVKKVSKKKK